MIAKSCCGVKEEKWVEKSYLIFKVGPPTSKPSAERRRLSSHAEFRPGGMALPDSIGDLSQSRPGAKSTGIDRNRVARRAAPERSPLRRCPRAIRTAPANSTPVDSRRLGRIRHASSRRLFRPTLRTFSFSDGVSKFPLTCSRKTREKHAGCRTCESICVPHWALQVPE